VSQLLAPFRRILCKAFLLEDPQCCQGCRTCQASTTKRTRVERERLYCAVGFHPEIATCQHGTDWHQAAAQRFREAQNVGLNTFVLAGEQRPCATEARLHFVDNQQGAGSAAYLGGTLEEACRQKIHPAFGLQRLDDEGRESMRRQFSLQQLCIAERNRFATGKQLAERPTILCCARYRKRPHRLAVIGPFTRKHPFATRRNACQLQRGFYRLSTAVAEENHFQSAGRQCRKVGRKGSLIRIGRRLNKTGSLLLECIGQRLTTAG
jgi:hypothetical protein